VSAARVAGTDTREVMSRRTVRASVSAATLCAGVAFCAAFETAHAWRERLHTPAGLGPWLTLFVSGAALASGILAARLPARRARGRYADARLPEGVGVVVLGVMVAVYVWLSKDETFTAWMLPVVAIAGAWLVGRCARLARDAAPEDVTPAALGVVVAGALFGLAVAGHLALVARGKGLPPGAGVPRAALWTAGYLAIAAVNLTRAHLAFANDVAMTHARAAIVARPRSEGDALQLDGITVSFGSNVVLDDTAITARAGEMIALVGGNGAGKSTLLRVAAGLLAADRGRVVVGDDEVTTLLPEERAAAGLAFVSGARPIFPDLTVVENLRVAAYRTHLTTRAFESATRAIFDFVPMLTTRATARAGVLSGGEQRLLAVAQTLYRRPVVLLADELTLGLDAHARIAVIDLLRVLADEGVAVVVVDHDLPALLPRADRAALLADGVVTYYDEPQELLRLRSDLLPATFLAGVTA
jgi:branched-chain amino acid transport system ATP-binding protein